MYFRHHPAMRAPRGRLARLAGLGLLGALLAGAPGCGSCGRTAASSDPLRYIPADAALVLQLDMTRLTKTQLATRLRTVLGRKEAANKRWDDLVKQSGFDPMRDLKTVVFAMPYTPEPHPDAGTVLVGRFNQRGIAIWLEESDAGVSSQREEKYGQHTIYVGQDASYYLSFVDASTALIGTKGWIHKMIDLADGKGQSVRSRPEMAALLGRARGGRVLWAVAQLPEDLRRRAAENESPYKDITAIVGSLDFAAGLEADLRADTTSDAVARTLADKATTDLEKLRSMFSTTPEMAAMLPAVAVKAEGKTFHATVTMQQQQLDAVITKIEQLLKGGLPRLPVPDTGGLGQPPSGSLPPFKLSPPGSDATKGPGLLKH